MISVVSCGRIIKLDVDLVIFPWPLVDTFACQDLVNDDPLAIVLYSLKQFVLL